MRENKPRETETRVPIASITPSPIDLQNVEEILNKAEIDFVLEGSRAYQISVKPEDAIKAVRILKSSEVANRIIFY